MSETEEVLVYNYEELKTLWESDLVKRSFIIDQMGRLLRQGGEDTPKAKAFLEELAERFGGNEKKYIMDVLHGRE